MLGIGEEKTAVLQADRIEWLDILRCVAMYIVTIGHAALDDSPESYRYYVYSFHMPLFFIISGAGYYLQTRRREFTFPELVKNKAKALIWPYFTLNIAVLVFLNVYFRIISHKTWPIERLIYGIFYSNETHVESSTNATWFLTTLFITMVVFFLIRMWSKDEEKLLTLAILTIGAYGYVMSMREEKFPLPWHLDTVPIALIFVLMGYLFIKHLDFFVELLGSKKRQVLLLLLCLILGFWCAKYNVKISMSINTYGSFLLFIGSVVSYSTACLIVSMWLPKLKILKFIGKNTIIYLAFHSPFLRVIKLFSEEGYEFVTGHPVLAGTVVFVALIPVAWMFDRYLPFLLGRKRQ